MSINYGKDLFDKPILLLDVSCPVEGVGNISKLLLMVCFSANENQRDLELNAGAERLT